MHVTSGQMRFRPWRATQGSVAVLVAVLLVLLLGFVGLGTEITFALLRQRQMQATASAAALGGATALMTGHPSDLTVEARAEAAAAGFTNGVSGVTVTVNHPPASGNYTANSAAVEVIVGEPLTLPLSSLFHAGGWTVSARAVALAGKNSGDCLLELDSSSTTGVKATGGAVVTLNKCGLAVNATGASALTLSGGAVLTADSVTVSGGESVSGGATINATNGNKSGQPAVADPYSSVPVPTSTTPCPVALTSNTNQTLNPGSSGICTYTDFKRTGGTVTMQPGIYIINGSTGGSFNLSGGASLTGTGVTIVLTGSGSNYATVSISGNSPVSLTAPTTGATAGLVFFQDPKAPTTGKDNLTGGSDLTLTGALYFPSQQVTYSGGASSSTTCTQLVAYDIVFTGGVYFASNCAGTGVKTIGSSPSLIVE